MKNLFLNLGLIILFNITITEVSSQELSIKEIKIRDYIYEHRISYDSAAMFISDFLKYSDLLSKAQSYTIGGFIPKFEPNFNSIKVIKFYACYDEQLISNKVFLAFKNGEIEDPKYSDCYAPFKDKETMKSVNNFDFDGVGITKEYIKNYLLNLEKGYSTTPGTVNSSMVCEFAESFIINYTIDDHSIQSDICLTALRQAFDSLITQYDSLNNYQKYDCVGVRYFFGLEMGKDNLKPNKIRLVFVGVLPNGKNLVYYDSDKKHPARFMEKNWPPDPAMLNLFK